jgi:hypothetical protein
MSMKPLPILLPFRIASLQVSNTTLTLPVSVAQVTWTVNCRENRAGEEREG